MTELPGTSVVPQGRHDSAPVAPLGAHYHATRLRADTWNHLKVTVFRLVEGRTKLEDVRREIEASLSALEPIESYWAFPGREGFAQLRAAWERQDHGTLSQLVERIVRSLVSHSYRRRSIPLVDADEWDEEGEERDAAEPWRLSDESAKPYFEVLVVDRQSSTGEQAVRRGLRSMRRPEDPFVYDVLVVPSFEDAVIAVLFNHNIQSVVLRYGFPFESQQSLDELSRWLEGVDRERLSGGSPAERADTLGALLQDLRPELDLYLVTDASVEDTAGRSESVFRRVFYRQEDYTELHLSLLRGVRARFRTPFFNALREYAEQPTGVFHALPISRGKSILRSHWIRDMAQFYGMSIFLAETSATSGGLDSLLDPHGPIKEAQELAARAFGARRTFFVTNGTTGANKIVVQSLVRPGDIVLVDRDCHKSHHYALTLAGAQVLYLDAYPLHEFSMYGAVPLEQIRETLLHLKRAGKLDRVRLLILTNCTFDGVVYDPLRVMRECLAIKPDLIFLWDEAWFGFARFSPPYRRRTAMYAADRLRRMLRSPDYLERRAAASGPERWPDPEQARVRVYATQSTHKTLTSLRQGSMIHVHDQDFHGVEDAFRDAYMTHTSTSPNYQILASLDIGRRQGELEGYEFVGTQIELAMTLREKVMEHPLLRRWFRFLTVRDLIPERFRPSGEDAFYDRERGWRPMLESWRDDEFVLDPTRLTLYIGATGVDGDTFKKRHLMEQHGIQVNKTTRNSCLFMTNIGTSRSSVAHLINALVRLAQDFEQTVDEESPSERKARDRRIDALAHTLPPLPDFSAFHERFGPNDGSDTPDGDLRTAFFLGGDETNCEFFPIQGREIDDAMGSGRTLVSAGFVTPYPPGFPILVPGQVLSPEILQYLRALDTKEVHGYREDLGLRVFTEATLTAPSGGEK